MWHEEVELSEFVRAVSDVNQKGQLALLQRAQRIPKPMVIIGRKMGCRGRELSKLKKV
jgi:hypothetical protein